MKHFTQDIQSARQGEIYFVRINSLPEDAKPVSPVDGKYVVAHSETGHHHVIEAKENVRYYSSNDSLVSYLEVVEATDKTEALLEHMRNFHQHETIAFSNGIYAAITGRESSPQGWRKVVD